MILKKRTLIIGCCIGFVFLLVLTYSLYKEKRMYEQYLTMNVRQDMVDMKSAIINNDILFERILKNVKITNEMVEDGEQASQLYYNFTDMTQIVNKYNMMNLTFSEEANWLVKPASLFTNDLGQDDVMPPTLHRIRMTFERLDITSYPVTPELKARIEEYQQLNQRWLNIVGDFESKETNENDWPKVLNDLEKESRNYFQENNVDFVDDDVWRDAFNPRYE
ncbi:hypothetical protein PAEAM_05210 [Paenibacillus sp. GM1FR]|uniref:hypothetical protein n=1 Tax=Paenibacillus sp. GM1FR TaxID=2059267 RepID=UPI000C279097|nr:hypothetical protein [Paenibacillus sp. GM1FR]PJN64927.1 hypothetical protein PAEAM_05210 [Paenibacillus sp. GM1FR]